MQRAEIRAFNIDSVLWAECPKPEPEAGQVLVRIRSLSLNFRDLLMVKGLYNPKLKLPFVPVSDGAGEITAIGSGVTRWKVGDRVAGIFMQTWIEGEVDEVKAKSSLGGGIPGVASEYAVLSGEGIVRVPDYLSFEEASTLPCAAVTAWNALFASGAVKPGDTVVLLGTGGVSIFALQFAALAGARVILTSSSDDKAARAREMGAAETINYVTTPDWAKRVRELTGGRGADHIVEVGGAGTLAQSMKAVRSGGTISLIGVLAEGSEVNPTPVLMRSLRVQGIFVGSRVMFENMLQAMEPRQIRPVIDRVFEADDLQSALRYMESGKHFGKVCVRLGAG